MPDPQYTFRGAWAAATVYVEDDLVTLGLTAYVCVDGNTGDVENGPPNADFWDLLVEPATTAYATAAEYRNAIGKSGTSEDTAIDRAVTMASRWWDRKLRRSFGKSALENREFRVHRGTDGFGSSTLFVDDIAESAGLVVTIGDEVVEASSYELLPLNAAKGPEPQPYDRIARIGSGWSGFNEWPLSRHSQWPLGRLITITARWGWPAVPAAIVEATIEWAAIWRGESIRATERVNEMDQVVSTSPYHLSQLKRVTEAYQQGRSPVAGIGGLRL